MSEDKNVYQFFLDWIAENNVQLWPSLKRGRNHVILGKSWTVQVIIPKKFIQETKPTLLEALDAAYNTWLRFQT